MPLTLPAGACGQRRGLQVHRYLDCQAGCSSQDVTYRGLGGRGIGCGVRAEGQGDRYAATLEQGVRTGYLGPQRSTVKSQCVRKGWLHLGFEAHAVQTGASPYAASWYFIYFTLH